MNTAIIVAAGSGERFKSDIPKQFVEIKGKPVIIHTLEKFELCPAVSEIILVLGEDQTEAFQTLSARYSFTKIVNTIVGAKSRAGSVLKGLNATHPATEVVAVHDGVRPMVSLNEIAAVIEKAAEIGAACLVAEVTDTIKRIEDGNIAGTLDRTKLRRALTPQAFRYDILRRAFDERTDDLEVTDECMLLEQIGLEIAYVEGSPSNIKITRPEDLIFAQSLL